jgi:hypothetical protein
MQSDQLEASFAAGAAAVLRPPEGELEFNSEKIMTDASFV